MLHAYVQRFNVIRIWNILQNILRTKQGSVREAPVFVTPRDENGTDIFRPYSRPNPFRGVLIRPYPSPDI
jgi:hypothetical protein